MKLYSRARHRLLSAMAISLLAVPAFARPATAHKVDARAVPTKPATASNSIIALPLVPIVPAAQRLCGARTPDGLGYSMLRLATGPKPAGDATVLVNYIGYLAATGAVFDQGMRSPLPVGEVIPGFSQGLQMMARNGLVRLCIPAAMGYGAQASGPIPANSDLVFQVELLDFKTAGEIEGLRGAPAADPAVQKDAAPQP